MHDFIDLWTYVLLLFMAMYVLAPACRSLYCLDYTHRYAPLPV